VSADPASALALAAALTPASGVAVAAGPGEVIMSGELFVAIPLAILAGFVSFASPCVLPVVPGYLGLVGAVSGADAGGRGSRGGRAARGGAGKARGGSGSAPSASASGGSGALTVGSRNRVVLGAALFVLGFSIVYVVTGAAFGQVGLLLLKYQDLVMRVLGLIVILMGFVFLGQVTFFQRTLQLRMKPVGLLGAPLLGIVFGIGWAPCLGPTLIAIQALSFQSGSPARGALLAFAYAIGLGIPFILVAFGLGRATRAFGWLRRHIRAINIAGGVLLIAIGACMVLGVWQMFLSSVGSLLPGFTSPL